MQTTHPEIASEWSEKNLPLKPDEVNAKSRKNVWWKCRKCGNEWKSVVNARVKGTVCPVCAEREVLAGYNDLATTDSQLLSEWDYEQNKLKPTEVSRTSAKRAWWKCRHGHSWSMKINERTILNKGCRICEQEYLSLFPALAVSYYSNKKGLKAELGSDRLLGEYRGFQMELYFDTVQRNYVVKLKGETSRDVPLGDDSHGNIVRIDNGIERFEEALADTKNSLENTEKQFETAKQEIEKPFAKEEELRAKTARLDELNILLNMDKKENEIVGGEPDEGEMIEKKSRNFER